MAAVTLEQNITFNSTTNTTYIIGVNLSIDNATLINETLNLTNSSGGFVMSATPSSGVLNVTVLQFNTTYWKFNLTGSNTSATVNFTVSNATLSSSFHLKKSGAFSKAVASNSTGQMYFNYDGGLSNVTLEILASFANGATCTIGGECTSSFCVHSICRPAATYCGDGFCDTEERCALDCGEGSPSTPTSSGNEITSLKDAIKKLEDKTPPRQPYIPSYGEGGGETPSKEIVEKKIEAPKVEDKYGKLKGVFSKFSAVIKQYNQLFLALTLILAVLALSLAHHFLHRKK